MRRFFVRDTMRHVSLRAHSRPMILVQKNPEILTSQHLTGGRCSRGRTMVDHRELSAKNITRQLSEARRGLPRKEYTFESDVLTRVTSLPVRMTSAIPSGTS